MSRMGIPTLQQFKSSTSPAGGKYSVKRMTTGRGSELALVDTAIQEWDAACVGVANPPKIKALRHMIAACSLYLKSRVDKTSTLSIARKNEVRRLKDLALAALGQLDAAEAAFASNKSKSAMGGRFDGKTTALSGGYQHERTSYLKSGKSVAIAASAVHEEFDDFSAVSYRDYVAKYNELNQSASPDTNQVAYLGKNDRMKYLAIPQAGQFRYGDGTPLNTTGSGIGVGDDARRGDVWAMDRYGNLFVREPRALPGKANNFFNHSSFNAGNDVVCAGVIMFNVGGVLVYIDNCSGHYKPSSEALRSTLAFLTDSGVDLTHVRAGLMNPATGMPTSFRAGTVMATRGITGATPGDWLASDNAALHLPNGPIMA